MRSSFGDIEPRRRDTVATQNFLEFRRRLESARRSGFPPREPKLVRRCLEKPSERGSMTGDATAKTGADRGRKSGPSAEHHETRSPWFTSNPIAQVGVSGLCMAMEGMCSSRSRAAESRVDDHALRNARRGQDADGSTRLRGGTPHGPLASRDRSKLVAGRSKCRMRQGHDESIGETETSPRARKDPPPGEAHARSRDPRLVVR